MGRSLYPAALLFKEWRQKRWAALIVFLLICPSAFLNILPLLSDPAHRFVGSTMTVNGITSPMQTVDTWVLNFSLFCNQVPGRYTVGFWATLVVMGLAVYTLWSEKQNDVWMYTLSGPVSKRQVLRVAYTFDAGIILATFTLLAVYLTLFDLFVGLHYPLAGIIRWWLAELAIQGSMYSFVILLGMLFGNGVLAGILAYAVANVPMKVGVLLVHQLGANLVAFTPSFHGKVPLSWNLMWAFTHVSPLNWLGTDLTGSGWLNAWPYMAWFLIFSGLCYLISQRLFQTVSNERLSHWFMFSWSRHPLTLLLSGAIAYIVLAVFAKDVFTLTQQIRDFAVCTVVLWALFTGAGQYVIRKL